MKIIVLCLSIMFVFTSCENWLDVEPKTEIEVGTMFETEQGFKDALFGCYTLLSDADLYGAQMTCTFMDVLGQQYTLLGTTSSSYNNASRYIYTDDNCEAIIDGIWLGLYNTIANVNALIEGLEMQKDNLDPMFYALTKAEGYALRAFIYLDLVRLFTWGNLPARPEKLQEYAASLGADCAFFIDSEPAFATGIGSCLSPIDMGTTLTDCHVIIIKPSIAISTKSAYAHIHPHHPDKCCRDIINQPMETWKHELTNDFEEQAFKDYPELQNIKNNLYEHGAIYAQMSGSGSAMFGIFKDKPENIDSYFKPYNIITLKL